MFDMTIRLRTESGACLYEQIYEHIKREIRDGKLLTGERLPSTRSLAEYLQVARSTVDCAYGQLLDEGYVEARPCRGFFVCPLDVLQQLEPELQGGGEGQEEARREGEGDPAGAPEAALGGAAPREGRSGCPPWACDFSPYEIDMTEFPFSVWKKITKNILTDANSDLFSRGEPQGDHELRHTISRYLHSSRGVDCKPEQIIVGAGNDYLLLLLEKILGRHVRIAMENPTYLRSYRIFRSFAYPIATVDMDEGGMKVSRLEKENVSVAYVMPSHQFPSGAVMPIGRRLELLKWACGAPDRYVIEDDYDSEFRYHGKPIPALQASDEHGRVIYVGSFSKSIAPAIRVSFMVLPQALLEKYRSECFFYSCTVSRIDQSILNAFIRDGYFERHLNKMRKIYRAKHETLLERLRPFRDHFRISGENAGLHLLLTSKCGRTERELVDRAMDAGVKVYGLSDHMAKQCADTGTVLLGFGKPTQEEIEEGIRRLGAAWLD